MMRNRDEADAVATFRDRYGRPATDATRELERLVIGGDFGANGYTTMAQAHLMAERLELREGHRLLDVGSGRGWPGLYLAAVTGCSVVVTDIPEEGLRTARQRAAVDGLARRSAAVAASARRLPFEAESFDAVVHTDVLCWLTAKLSVLRACRRLLRPGGRTAYFTIFTTPGLSKRDHRRAVRRGPRAVGSRREQAQLLEAAGFVQVVMTDATSDFLDTARRWLRHASRLEGGLRATLGDALFDEQQVDRKEMIAALEEGLLSRALFVGTRPDE
jgi:2-polyprenyl-3-methyl-5-hydroxy-6-metoxy-1,4-benzoquinol methylase